MITALISRLVILAFGTLYPAYASYKAVRSKDVKEYVKWMMYWIVFALFTCVETFTDVLFSFWFPFYYELKVAIVFWLLSPATKGSSFLYRNFVHPAFQKREAEIDDYLSSAKEKGYTTVMTIGSKGVSYATNMIVQTAIKGGGGIFEQIRKSYSLSDLSPKVPESRQPRPLSNQLDTDTTDIISDPRPLPRGRRGINNPGVEMYFSEVDLNVRQYHGAEPLGEIRSTEDISSGYSSTDQLFGEGVLMRTSSVTSGRGRGRGGRLSQTRRPPLTEACETLEMGDTYWQSTPYPHPLHASPPISYAPEKLKRTLSDRTQKSSFDEYKTPQVSYDKHELNNQYTSIKSEDKCIEPMNTENDIPFIDAAPDEYHFLQPSSGSVGLELKDESIQSTNETRSNRDEQISEYRNLIAENKISVENVKPKNEPNEQISVSGHNNLAPNEETSPENDIKNIDEDEKLNKKEVVTKDGTKIVLSGNITDKISDVMHTLESVVHTLECGDVGGESGKKNEQLPLDENEKYEKQFGSLASISSATDSEVNFYLGADEGEKKVYDEKKRRRYKKSRAPLPPGSASVRDTVEEAVQETNMPEEIDGTNEDCFEDAPELQIDNGSTQIADFSETADDSSILFEDAQSEQDLSLKENAVESYVETNISTDKISKESFVEPVSSTSSISKVSSNTGGNTISKFIAKNTKGLFSILQNKKDSSRKHY